MSKEIFTIAKGNPTLLVEDCPVQNRLAVARGALRTVEQVGFVTTATAIPSLDMMGGELSVNGTIAFAKKLGGSGQLKASGLSEPVTYFQEDEKTTIKINLPYQTFPDTMGTVVAFEGIGYLCTDQFFVPRSSMIRDYWYKYNQLLGLPAFGFVLYNGEAIEPYVYVRETDSMISETACGSGSVAVSIVTGQKNITQPTLGRISILEQGNDSFWVSAKVARIGKIKKEDILLQESN